MMISMTMDDDALVMMVMVIMMMMLMKSTRQAFHFSDWLF